MIKKAFVVLIVAGLIQLIVVACCPEPMTYYNKIIDINIKNCDLQTELADSSIVSQSDLRIRMTISEETLAKVFNPPFLLNSAYATSCEDNFDGLKSDITSYSITCNKEILNTDAGEPIDNNKLSVYKIGFVEDYRNQRKSINEWIDILNNGGYLLAFEWFFEFNETVSSDQYLRFTMNIIQEDGTEFEIETKSVKVE